MTLLTTVGATPVMAAGPPTGPDTAPGSRSHTAGTSWITLITGDRVAVARRHRPGVDITAAAAQGSLLDLDPGIPHPDT
ncbi:hypothetical protein AB0L50_36250 [Streptomyces flaveolus]|uniref:hypothetical protein n=1 Tax=Streptomyces flaveolus TaxID=67297 RepID=UPI003427B135